MEGVVFENYIKIKLSNIPMMQFYSRLSGESDRDYITSATHP